MKVYDYGWVLLEHHGAYLDRFWLDGFPVAPSEDQYSRGYGAEKRLSPIYQYDNGGIGHSQWLNVTHDSAAILKADGGWKTGGVFHLWVSAGAGTRPYEVPLHYPVTIEAGDPSGWQERQAEAIVAAETVLGLRPVTE